MSTRLVQGRLFVGRSLPPAPGPTPLIMADSSLSDLKPQAGDTVTVTVSRTIVSEGARKTIERLFMSDSDFRAPIDARSARHSDRPKRRGGRIYTKYARKVHPVLEKGTTATVKATPQHVRDLQSVSRYIEVK